MSGLDIHVTGADVVPYAAEPQIAFRLRVEAGDALVHTITLRCQIQIEPARRQYGPAEQERLRDLFGQPDLWGRTLRNMLWTHASVVVPRFTGVADVALTVPCTFDFNVGATKYFHGVEEGDLPLFFLFSGTVFHEADGGLQVSPIPWDREARFRLPVATWRALMDHYYPNSAWLSLRRDVFDRLLAFKTAHGIPTWEAAIERALDAAGDRVPS